MTDADKYKGLYLCEQIKGLEMMTAAARAAYQGHATDVVGKLYPEATATDNIKIDFASGEVTLDGVGNTADSQQAIEG